MESDGLPTVKANPSILITPVRSIFISIGRKQVETAFSDIAKYLPKKIHAVTISGFLIKRFLFF
jgi:hypothetical protein